MTFGVDDAEASSGSHRFSLGGLELSVFTHSFLGFGQDSAQAVALRLASSYVTSELALPAQQVYPSSRAHATATRSCEDQEPRTPAIRWDDDSAEGFRAGGSGQCSSESAAQGS